MMPLDAILGLSMLVKSCNMILDTMYRGLQMKRNCLYMGSNFKFFWLPSGAKSVFR